MYNPSLKTPFLFAIPLFAIVLVSTTAPGCTSPPRLSNQGEALARRERAPYPEFPDRWDEVAERLKQKRQFDQNAWRFILHFLFLGNDVEQSIVAELLIEGAKISPDIKVVAMALLETKCLSATFAELPLWLTKYALLLGLPVQYGSELFIEAQENSDRVRSNSLLDKRAMAFIEESLSSHEFEVQLSSISVIAASLEANKKSRSQLLSLVSAKGKSADKRERAFWFVVDESIREVFRIDGAR